MPVKVKVRPLVKWIKGYADKYHKSLVVGVTGDIDSAVVSALCVLTGLRTTICVFPIQSATQSENLAALQCQFLKKYPNVGFYIDDFTEIYKVFKQKLFLGQLRDDDYFWEDLIQRIKMIALYHTAQCQDGIVIGTNNRIKEKVGCFTKYGENAVDISPLGNVTKTQVYHLAKELGLLKEIVDAPVIDEEKLGATYAQLEHAMSGAWSSPRAKAIFDKCYEKSLHKTLPVPTFLVGQKNEF